MSPAGTARTCCCWLLLVGHTALAGAPQQALILVLLGQLPLVGLLSQPELLVMLPLGLPADAAAACVVGTAAVPAAWVMLSAAAVLA
jgi:hypothetical protein